MKLHLPKLLYAALLGVFALPVMGATFTSADIVTPTEGGSSYLNVGMENSTDTWSGDLTVGDTDSAQGDVDYVGAFNESWGWVTPDGGKTNTTITSGLKVSGSLTVQGGKILLGGQYEGGSSYTGLEATGGISVTGGVLTATKITTTDLTVSGGTVSTSTGNCTSGNASGTSAWYLAKKSYIKNSLTISGGSLSFGYTSNVQGIGANQHSMTAFGSGSNFTLSQSGGTLRVYGDMDLKSGSTVNQTDNAGIMVLRDTIYMGGTGTTTFNQNGDNAKLVLGRLESVGNILSKPQCDFVFNQSGDGLIHLAYGSNLYKAGTITLNQTGGGNIIIGGEHDTKITGALPSRGYALAGSFEAINTTYTINQKDSTGTVTLQSGAEITVDDLTVGADATLNVNGAMTLTGTASLVGEVNVGENATITYAETANMAVSTTLAIASGNTMNFEVGSTSDADGAVQMAESGDFNATGGTLTLELSDVALQEMALGATLEGTEYGITLISNLSDADVLELESVINGALTLQKFETQLPVTMAEEGATHLPITIASSGLRLEGNNLQAVVIATNPNLTVPEPTTATLSLLALAALAARRRRK
ncbi:MAG: PEP-CTERM sorting domain-containing protein [Akkermansia sp.]|nr:PEP-CTERM sorting domain-containing protein [Akkermansia sp.]